MEEQTNLTPRQEALVQFLTSHFVSGKFWTIEEMVYLVRDELDRPYYTLNTNPYIHDKCATLSADIRTINWSVVEGCKIIIKDSKGGAKLCECSQEFEEWRKKELEPITKKCQYLNNLVYKCKQDGTVPIVDSNNEPIEEPKPVEVFQKEEPKKESKPVQISIWGW